MIDFDGNKFAVTGPCWIVVERASFDTKGQFAGGFVTGKIGPASYVAVFTDRDLANRFVEHGGRLKTLVPALLETPQALIGFLEGCKPSGCTHVGFDRPPIGNPVTVIPIQNVIDAARAFVESNPLPG